MTVSKESSKTLHQRIGAIQRRLGSSEVLTDKIGGRQNSYPSLRQALDTVLAIAIDEGVTITQPIYYNHDLAMTFVSTVLRDSQTGETEESLIPLDTTVRPQEIGSAITYFRRFTLLAALSLAPGGAVEDDAEAAEIAAQELQRVRQELKRLMALKQVTYKEACAGIGVDATKVPTSETIGRLINWVSGQGEDTR